MGTSPPAGKGVASAVAAQAVVAVEVVAVAVAAEPAYPSVRATARAWPWVAAASAGDALVAGLASVVHRQQ